MRIKNDLEQIEKYIKEHCFDDNIYNKWKCDLMDLINTRFTQSGLDQLGTLLTDKHEISFDVELRDHDKIICFFLVQEDGEGKAINALDGTYFLVKGDVIIALGKIDIVTEH